MCDEDVSLEKEHLLGLKPKTMQKKYIIIIWMLRIDRNNWKKIELL